MDNVSVAHSSLSEKSLVEEFNEEFTKTVLPVTIFVAVETVIGFFGNLLVLYVFLFRYHVCNFRYFVLCLAFTDITGTLTTMPGEVLTQLKWYVYPVPLICKIKSFFNVFLVSAEAFCLLTIAIDRYRKICEPFGWQIQPRVALLLCGLIYLLSVILAFPVAIFWGTRSLRKVYRNQTITVTLCEKDEQYANTNLPSDYTIGVNVIFGTLLFMMVVLYIFVARKVNKQKQRTQVVFNVKQASSSTGASSTATSGLSSDVGKLRYIEDHSELSLDLDSKSKTPKYQNVLPDGGLTTDEDDSTAQRHIFRMTTNVKSPAKSHQKKKTKRSENRLGRKTRIIIILTIIFIITTVCYLALLSFIAKSDDVLQEMSDTGRAFYFFFFRLYFVNHAMNPFVYFFLYPHFREVMKNLKRAVCKFGK